MKLGKNWWFNRKEQLFFSQIKSFWKYFKKIVSALTVNEERNYLRPRIFFIFSPKKEKSFIIELYSFIIEIKVIINVIVNNIDIHDQPSRMHRSPSRSRPKISDYKNFKDKINLFNKDISDLIIEYFGRNKSCQKIYFKQFISA